MTEPFSTAPASAADLALAQLARLRRKYGLALPEKISDVESSFAPLFAGDWEEETCATAHRRIHSLAGSSGTYGFTEISGIARAAEAVVRDCLDSGLPLPATSGLRLTELIAKLRMLAADAASQAAS